MSPASSLDATEDVNAHTPAVRAHPHHSQDMSPAARRRASGVRQAGRPVRPAGVSGERAAARWRRLVEARLADPDRPPPGTPADDERLAAYAEEVAGTGADDPFLGRVLGVADPGSTIVDVGAGSGRFALPLLRRGFRVVAVEPRGLLRSRLEARAQGARPGSRLTVIPERWQEVDPGPLAAGVVICTYVLPGIPDIVGFLRRLDAAGEHVMVYLDAGAGDADHAGVPTHRDLLPVLAELGLGPVDVEIVERPDAPRGRWRTVPGAILHWDTRDRP